MKFKPLYNPHTLTCTITVPDMLPSAGIQKIIGIARGLSFHQVDYKPYWHVSNSIVLGCNRSENEDTVRLFAYGYVKGDHFQHLLHEVEPNTKIEADLRFNQYLCSAKVKEKRYSWPTYTKMKRTGFKTFPIGFLLNNYAEIDNTNKQTPFHCLVEDLRVNGRKI